MNILISGSTGLIGSTLVDRLGGGGHRITRLVRSQRRAEPKEIEWDPANGVLDAAGLEGFDAVIHLAGEPIVGRWTPEKKERIRTSRVAGTRLLCEALTRLERPPRVLLCASASGIYGDRGDETLIEESPPGKGFLADVVRQWEAATDPAASAGIRVVNLRFSMVLSPRGGALRTMLPPFRLGLGGPLGSGRQFVSWIALDDVAGIAEHALMTDSLHGPINVASPHPLRNYEFTAVLAHVLHRPAIMPAPEFALRLLFGELADEALLASQRLSAQKIQNSGYQFKYPELESALKHLLE